MAIEIIVEDGSNVPNANSYVSVEDAITYAANRGLVLPAGDASAGMLIQAMDYLASKACDFMGEETYETQALDWPRTGACIRGKLFPADAIPKQLIDAQIQLAIAVSKGIELFPNVVPTDYVTEETVGPITTKYVDATKIGSGDLSPSLTAVEALLLPLMQTCGQQSFSIRTQRV